MNGKIRLVLGSVLALAMLLWAVPALAIPPIPHAFYGTVLLNGSNAPVGTVVSAEINGENAGSFTVTETGQYGNLAQRSYLAVSSANTNDGDTITFYVNSVSTGQTATFETGGGPTELPLTVAIAVPPPPLPGTEPPPEPIIVDTTLFGESVSFTISPDGEILEIIEVTTADGKLTITIPAGTIALDKNKHPITTLTMDIDLVPPAPPEDANIIGIAYEFGPDGAVFDPPLTFTWSYDPNALPAGVAEADLVVAYYDETAGEWVELPSTVDPVTNTITVLVSNFTSFAIIAAVPPPPTPAPAPPPTTAPAPVIIVAPPPPAPAPAPAPAPVPAPALVVPPAPPALPVSPPFNWPLWVGIIAAAVSVGLIVYFFVIRPRTR